jgi:hypothetical protein
MTDAVPTENKPAQTAVNIAEGLVQGGESALEAEIISAVPAMGTPVWRQVWEAVLDKLVTFITEPLARLSGCVVIEIDEYLALRKAAQAQAALDAAKKIGDPNAVAQASAHVDQAVAAAVHYVGAIHT